MRATCSWLSKSKRWKKALANIAEIVPCSSLSVFTSLRIGKGLGGGVEEVYCAFGRVVISVSVGVMKEVERQREGERRE